MNRLDLIKTLLPGFLPILVYVLSDSLFGEKIGLITAVLFGMAELVYGYLKEKRLDGFIILDVGLITLLGLTSILLDTPIFFKIKPALIEMVLIMILGYALYSPKDLMTRMFQRYTRNALTLPTHAELKKMMLPLLFILAVHAALTLAAAWWMSKEVWAFVSGGLFYIFFALYMLVRLLKVKMTRRGWRRHHADDEWFDVVDIKGKVLFQAPRTICHKDPTLLHPVVHLHVFNRQMQLYLQKRPDHKIVQPNKWDTAVGGHVHSGETIPEALLRESMEEINLDIRKTKVIPLAQYLWKNEHESELVFAFYCQTTLKPVPNPDEITDGKFWTARSIREKCDQGLFTPNFVFEFKQFILPLFDQAIPHL
jgi:isopentenyldiphosphate isomerase/intracellular septation protein A